MTLPLLALVAALASPAGAQAPSPCPPEIVRALGDAAAQTHLALVPLRCDGEIVVLRLETPDFTGNVEVRRDGEGYFRAGRFGVSPILEVADYREVPATFREGVERLVGWLDAHDDALSATAPAPASPPRALPPRVPSTRLLVACALALLGLGWLRARRPRLAFLSPAPRPSGRLVALAFLAALLLRVAFAPWECFRGGQGPLWIAALYGHAPLEARPGHFELYGAIAHLAGARVETAVFATNAALSAATVAAFVAIVQRLGASARAAAFVALALAVDPVTIRMSASESYFVPIAALFAFACLLALAADTRLDHGRRGRALALFAAAALVVAQGARIHPAAWPLLACVPLVLLATRPPLPRRVARALGLSAIIALLLSPSVTMLDAARGEAVEALAGVAPETAIALALASALAVALTPPPRRRVLLFVIPTVALAVWTAAAYDPLPHVRAGFYRMVLPTLLTGAVFAVPRALRGSAPIAALALLLVVAGVGVTLRDATTLDSSALENRLVRAALDELPSGCLLLHAGAEPMLPLYHGARLGEPPRGRALANDRRALAASGVLTCAYYHRGSYCATPEGAHRCPEIEEGAALRHVRTTRIPARSHGVVVPFVTDEIAVELFEVER